MEVDPPRLGRLNPAIPRDLRTIVHKAIEKDPGHRYATAAALAEDLHRFVVDEPICARRVSDVERAWRWCRRNLALSTALFGVAMLIVTIAVGSSVAPRYYARREQRQRELAAENANQRDVAQGSLYQSLVREARAI